MFSLPLCDPPTKQDGAVGTLRRSNQVHCFRLDSYGTRSTLLLVALQYSILDRLLSHSALPVRKASTYASRSSYFILMVFSLERMRIEIMTLLSSVSACTSTATDSDAEHRVSRPRPCLMSSSSNITRSKSAMLAAQVILKLPSWLVTG